jgi:hypothetical protein
MKYKEKNMLYKEMVKGTKLKFKREKNGQGVKKGEDCEYYDGSGVVEFFGPHFIMLRDDHNRKHTITRNDIISKKIRIGLA